MNDTITAISTTLGIGAISIIRVSGKEAIEKVNNITSINLKEKQTHTVNYGYIIENNNIIDEVLITIMKAPKTFTTEDIVEINCHGGLATTEKVLELVLKQGIRLAEPGEFTKRAFLNGRIDLLEAESVMDIINSKTEKSLSLAVRQLTGSATKLISDLREEILTLLASIEVKIDYPEYEDIEDVTHSELLENINTIEIKMKKILEESKNAKIIKDGINTSIIGKPNVGKSSILNKLIDEEKAIVTSIEGTTRDIVEGNINIDGIALNLVDTAGIRKTDDIVENIGVQKSLDQIEKSDLILFVLDNNRCLEKSDEEILKKLKNKKYLILINKNDLSRNLETEKLDPEKIIYISALNNEGFDELKSKIKKMFSINQIEKLDLTYLTSSRSIALLKKAYSILPSIKDGIKNNLPIDMIEIDIKEMWNILGQIIGETYEDELINKLFSQFCLGK